MKIYVKNKKIRGVCEIEDRLEGKAYVISVTVLEVF